MLQTINTDTEELKANTVKNCLVYARVSTDRQVQTGHSLEDQVTRLVKFARLRKWRILEIYKDGGKSGNSTTGRPEFTRMLERCGNDNEVDAVLLEETDRFARNAHDHLSVKSFLKKHDVELIATEQPNFGDDPVGNFVDLVMAGANQLQREITGEKTKRTMIALAEKGIQPGVAVLGYLNSFQKDKPWQLDNERVYFIKEIFRRFHTGNYSAKRIEEELYGEGLRTRQGKRVHASLINRILTDVRYAGKVKYIDKVYPGQHDAIVSMADIQKSREILTKRNKGADRSRKHNWLLSGLVHCKECGTLMSGEQHIKKDGRVFKYYRCLGPKNRQLHCTQPQAPMGKIHDQLEKQMGGIKFTERFLKGLEKTLQDEMSTQDTDVPHQVRALEDRKKAIERKMDKLEDQIIAETISQERVKVKYLPLKDELQAVESQIAKFNKPSANLDQHKIDTIIKFVKQLPKLYQAFNDQERKQFLKWFIEKIWIKEKKIVEITYTKEFQALMDQDLVRIRNGWLPG